MLVTDVSSVVTDFLASHKPYVMTNPQALPPRTIVASSRHLAGPRCGRPTWARLEATWLTPGAPTYGARTVSGWRPTCSGRRRRPCATFRGRRHRARGPLDGPRLGHGRSDPPRDAAAGPAPRVRGAAARAARAVEAPRRPVSVVIPVYDVEDYIDACLSACGPRPTRRCRSSSWTRVHRRLGGDRPAARRRGPAVRGREPGQRRAGRGPQPRPAPGHRPLRHVPRPGRPAAPGRLRDDGRSLEASGSDFVVGSVRRLWHGTFSSAPWIDQVHERDRIGISIEDFPPR